MAALACSAENSSVGRAGRLEGSLGRVNLVVGSARIHETLPSASTRGLARRVPLPLIHALDPASGLTLCGADAPHAFPLLGWGVRDYGFDYRCPLCMALAPVVLD